MQLTLECRQQHEEAAGGGGIWQTTHQKTFKAEFTYTGVRPQCLIAICCTEEEENKAMKGTK